MNPIYGRLGAVAGQRVWRKEATNLPPLTAGLEEMQLLVLSLQDRQGLVVLAEESLLVREDLLQRRP